MIVIDPSRFYKENSSLGLNKLFLRAELTHGDGKSEKKEVIGYYEIGESEKDRDVQKAFAFQTFDNMAGAMGNIYFVVRDAIFALFGKGCWDKATGVKTEIDGILEACPVPSEEAKYKEFVDRLDRLYNLLSPESESVLDLLTSGSESLLVNEIANEVLEIDADSMQAILTQMKSDLKSLRDPEKKLEEGAKKIVRERLLRRTILLARDMAEQVREVERLAGLLTGAKSQDNLTKLAADEGCPDAFHISRREFRAASLLAS